MKPRCKNCESKGEAMRNAMTEEEILFTLSTMANVYRSGFDRFTEVARICPMLIQKLLLGIPPELRERAIETVKESTGGLDIGKVEPCEKLYLVH